MLSAESLKGGSNLLGLHAKVRGRGSSFVSNVNKPTSWATRWAGLDPAPPNALLVSYNVVYNKQGAGGHGPRAQALEGAAGQLVGANFKKKIRPRQISKVTSLQWPGLT